MEPAAERSEGRAPRKFLDCLEEDSRVKHGNDEQQYGNDSEEYKTFWGLTVREWRNARPQGAKRLGGTAC